MRLHLWTLGLRCSVYLVNSDGSWLREKACPGMTLQRGQLAQTLLALQTPCCKAASDCDAYLHVPAVAMLDPSYDKLHICKPGRLELWESLVIESRLIAIMNIVPISPLYGKVPGL